MKFQTAIRLIYPPRCLACGDMVESDFGLCGPCWADASFIDGLVCETCGAPLQGEPTGQPEYCEDCHQTARVWGQGRAALIYRGTARKIVLGLKHGDREDVVKPAARWMARAGRSMELDQTILIPVPLHWTRLLKRRYNQSALLANHLGRVTGAQAVPDLLRRIKRTPSLDGKSKDERFALLADGIDITSRHKFRIQDQTVTLVDDVMTTGATLAACAEVCLSHGAKDVKVLTLARVVKDA